MSIAIPAGSDFPMSSEALPLPSLELPLMEKDLQYGTVVAACTKHRIACHLLRGHAAGTLRASLSVDQYERGNDRMLESYSTQDYGYEHPDSNPATAIYVPVVASPLYSPYSGTATGHVPP